MTDAPELPPGLALAWGVAERPERAPRRELSIERIVAAAVEIADTDGLGAVSMARVAKSLGFTTMSLYRYVTSKDDLLLLMQESVIDVEFPPAHEPADWRAELREWALVTLALYRAHPWVLDIPITGAPLTPNNLRAADAGLRALRSTPLADEEKIATILLVNGYTRNAAALGRDLDRAATEDDGAAAAAGLADTLRALVDEVRFPFLRPLVERGSYIAQTPGLDEVDDVQWGLDRTLDGIAVLIEHRAAGAPHAGDDDAASVTPSGTDPGSRELAEEAAARARTYAGDPRVKKAAHRRKDAERQVREARKRLRELEKAEQAARQAEAEAARQAAARAARD
ncbi:TetR family transcriptional regulator [Isoptericola sp. CG 20/1183]|uniref:TetR family transcriptional regulator n=1 Tax=Isoptericola halotolerans TaxID=300560 RepID=A0ABX5EKI9_9MICO|nr:MULTISPECIES: TetR/AcrR family transcriptional regulator [Isoptericola]PRZ09372.1 TetR family transcriptional regulator [Isoptericola sp. CG 20/1183]PRZ10173.1 TetR family transcriptional regulator [Isoptericola halotolerans]